MKLRTSILFILFLLAACSNGGDDNAQSNNKTANNKTAISSNDGVVMSEKNKQIALKNEITKATEAAQALEKQGRQMDSFRLAADAESARQCKVVEADLQRQAKDLEAKIKSFPEPFNSTLASVTNDLNACVSCSKTAATPACVRARASINDAIKQIFAR